MARAASRDSRAACDLGLVTRHRMRPTYLERRFAPDVRTVSGLSTLMKMPLVAAKCAVVLDTFSRQVADWSIDSSHPAALFTKALLIAIVNRGPQAGVDARSDWGLQFTSCAFPTALSGPGSCGRSARSVTAGSTTRSAKPSGTNSKPNF